jgi:general secretion pathway protein M
MTAAIPRLLPRLAALGLLLAVPAVVYLAAVMPVADHIAGLEGEVATLEESLERYQRIADQRVQLAAQVRGAADDEPDSGLYLDGSSDALAAAQLQELMKKIVGASGGTLDSVRVMESVAEGPYRRVSLQLLIETRIAGLRALLYGVEAGTPYLFIKSISVENVSGVRPDRPMLEPADLDVRLEVFGYRKG